MVTTMRVTLIALAAALSAAACAEFGKCESAACIEDAKISGEVKRNIDERPSLRIFNIDVQASNRDVYLWGLVDGEMDRSRAEQIASAVPGVKKVYNGLAIMGNGNH
ncbi:MAG TPA: BON domain-containing protein [Burkholderiaceae bacterium]|nr:BON domain-containing protein [Burkholderiaceae bacterium]